ncbi:MAG TPA: S8 family serine peptidase [Candidatus Limnocylindrales bacterium]|nr:S8 family serine peptidase [Candidatus Limnocylindrales bacterium]
MNRRLLTALGASALLVVTTMPAAMAADPEFERPERRTSEANPVLAHLDRSLVGASGSVQATIQLVTEPVARANGNAAQKARGTKVTAEQDAVFAKLAKLDADATLLGRSKIALNSISVEADAASLRALATDKRVTAINRVRDYELDLSETVPFIGATAVHDLGVTGEGITVAVIDSGIDYTHVAFGGPGTDLAYKQAYGTKTKDQKNRKTNDAYKGSVLFPTAKVIGGFDFVGEAWVGGAGSPPLAPDPDPIDCSPAAIGCGGGHGTHVADIIAGAQGVAPGATILAYKACSSITTACSGIAMLQGIDAALDPNNDGLTNDHADIINMSIGSQYGQSDDDSISRAVETATVAGILTVASAGNGGDKPYVTGTPAAAPSALSVAQTAVPSSTGFAMLLSTDGSVPSLKREAVFQSWSHVLTPEFEVTNVPVQYGNGATPVGNALGCDPFPAGSLTGKVVLVDRGVCNFSAKIANIAAGGGKIGVIGLVAPGDPFDGTLGLCPDNLCAAIPGYMVSQGTANSMKLAAARVSFDDANSIDLVEHMVGSSSRGPDNNHNTIKPEIGAPGASVSAEVGTGDGTTPFGGTSGAAPMVAGSAALLMEAYGGRGPLEIKAALINTGFTDIMNRPVDFGGTIAPVTRIGGGEVRVDRAHATQAAAWDKNAPTAALNFGFHDVTANMSVTRTVRIHNYGGSSITYGLASTFRFADDQANGAVAVTPASSSVTVGPGGDADVDVTLNISAGQLRTWTLDSGINGANPTLLQTLEYDGYLMLDAAGTANDIHLPWQVLPRRSSAVTASSPSVAPGGTVTLTNAGAGRSWVGSFSLLAESPDDPDTGVGDDRADVDLRYVGVRQITDPADAIDTLGCESGYGIMFAVNTWDRQVHANGPALFEFDLDIDQNGTIDFAVFNFDLSNAGTLADGRNFTFAQNVTTGATTAFWPTIHPTNSGNTVVTVCGEQIGLDIDDVGSEIDVVVLAADWYNSGAVTDVVETSIVVGGDRYTTNLAQAPFGAAFGGTIAGGGAANVVITDNGEDGTNPTETGILFTTDETLTGILAFANSGGATQPTEAIAVEVTAP